MNVNVALFGKFVDPFLSFFQRFLKWVRISPSEIGCVGFRIEVLKCMSPGNLQILASVI